MSNDQIPTTRLAPSPTGALHLGNARTFLINWAIARQSGQRIVLRIEDLDGPRVKKGADESAIRTLEWLGLDWDEGPYYQRNDLEPYQQALDKLRAKGLVYPCSCSRKDIEAAQSAPNAGDHELRYPGTCRPADGVQFHEKGVNYELADTPVENAWRLRVPNSNISFHDDFQGQIQVNVQQNVGDFVVATKMGLPAYQLAVVVDDARQGINCIVRGDDLIDSAARQLWLYQMLELQPPAHYIHLPLVVGEDGRRLAKRHGDTRIDFYRKSKVTPERIIGLLAYWSGITNQRIEMDATEFANNFQLNKLPKKQVVFTQNDHNWLLA